MKKSYKILVLTSTFPKYSGDMVPSFVQDQIITLKENYPYLNFIVVAPDDNKKINPQLSQQYKEYRFRYFVKRLQSLNELGILPSIKKNFFLGLILPFYLISQFFFTIKVVYKEKPDLIYAHMVTPQAILSFLIKKLYKIPYVFSTHAHDATILAKIPILGKIVLNGIIKNSKSFTSDTPEIENNLKRLIKKKNWKQTKSNIVPMGVNVKKYDNTYPDSFLNVDSNKIIISFLGRFVEKKGVEILINTFAEILNTNQNIHLLICGKGSLKDKYLEIISDLDIDQQIQVVDVFNDIGKLKYIYNLSDIIVVPSIKTSGGDTEGLPVVLLESLYFGKTVIASIESNAGSVIDDGVNGFLFSHNIENNFRLTIEKVLKNNVYTNNEFSSKAKATGLKYSWSELSKIYYKILVE